MIHDILYSLIAFILSALCGFFFIPIILNFCKEKQLYDIPNSRKIHSNAIPRLGGLCFLPSMLLAFLATTLTYNVFSGTTVITISLWTVYFFVSLLLIYGVGLVDDIVGLSAKPKFIIQIMAATLLPLSGLYINNFYGFLGFEEIPFWIGAPFTIFVIVFINNAINLIDGIDGLAAGISFIALAGFLVCFLTEGVFMYAILIAGLMGVLVPFLYFNMFGNAEKNRKIFMGDSGSLTLGFILGFLAVKYSMDNPYVMFWRPDCLLLSYSFLVVPIYDVIRVSAMRQKHHTPVFFADKNHIHHKLMRAGLSQHQALVAILMLALLFIIVNASLSRIVLMELIICLDVIIWLAFHWVVNRAIRRKGRAVFVVKEGNE
jgi:UDP-N-acetylmuramyl pentapeptide phosphotransferase/UDP-N-acetylglucosamine-1-phosphate transferase